MSRRLKAVFMCAVLCMALVMMSACSATEVTFDGEWEIYTISMDDVVIGTEDIDDASGEDGAYVVLEEDGTGTWSVLGEEYTLTWTENEDGSATISSDDFTLECEIDEDGFLVCTNESTGVVYTFQ